jgi:hypothetical protein
MGEIATTRTPTAPQGSGALYVRVYGMTANGQRYDLPPTAPPEPGQCIVPGCDCGGVEVKAE